MRWTGLLAVFGIVCLAVAGCGGGDTGEPPAPLQVTLRSQAALDGYVTSGAGNVASTSGGIDVGDQDGLINGTFRNGFVSFDLAPLPAGAVVEGAALRCYQTEVVGSPYLEIGEIVIDHVDYGAALDTGDYGLASISSDIGSYTSSLSVGWRSVEVTQAVRDTISMVLPLCQFRLRFSLEPPGDGANDFATFEDTDSSQGTTNHPALVIEYSLP